MSYPYIGEIRLFAGNFAPWGWRFCNGQRLSIAQNELLFSLIGTTYGGDGMTGFNLPDLRGRVPVHHGTPPGGSVRRLGETGGQETVMLTARQMPAHTHRAAAASQEATSRTAVGNVPAQLPGRGKAYAPLQAGAPMSRTSITGGGQPHANLQPYLAINYIIAVEGVYPSRD